MKKDINCHRAVFKNWKDEVLEYGVEGLSAKNGKLLMQYIFDMEIGQNVGRGSKKGGRSFGRLNVSRKKLSQAFKYFEKKGVKDITKVKEKQLHEWANGLYNGDIKREDGEPYKYPIDFIRCFKAFYHWWMKVNRKKGIMILDICEDLELKQPETTFVHLTKEQSDKMLPFFEEEDQLLKKFLFDSLVRFPTEASSLTAKCVYEKDGEVWVDVPDSISKTFGRTFNLLYCGEALMKYIKKKDLKPDDYIFDCISDNNKVALFNKKLKKIAVQLFGDGVSHSVAKKKFSELSGYDDRHNGAVHLRQMAQKNGKISLDSIRQRGGWTDFKMLNYYTKMLGLSGKIDKKETLITEDKTRLEKELDEQKERINKFEFMGDIIEEMLEQFQKKKLIKIENATYYKKGFEELKKAVTYKE